MHWVDLNMARIDDENSAIRAAYRPERPDADAHATMFIEWVYATPGQPAEEYAVELSRRMSEMLDQMQAWCADRLNRLPPTTTSENPPSSPRHDDGPA